MFIKDINGVLCNLYLVENIRIANEGNYYIIAQYNNKNFYLYGFKDQSKAQDTYMELVKQIKGFYQDIDGNIININMVTHIDIKSDTNNYYAEAHLYNGDSYFIKEKESKKEIEEYLDFISENFNK